MLGGDHVSLIELYPHCSGNRARVPLNGVRQADRTAVGKVAAVTNRYQLPAHSSFTSKESFRWTRHLPSHHS